VKWPLGRHQREVKELRQRNEELQSRVAELETENAQLRAELAASKKHSGNSSKPPSSDIVKPSPKARGASGRRKIGGQPGHPRHQRPAFAPDQIDERKVHGVGVCHDCGSRDLEVLPDPVQVVQQVELLPKPFRVTEHVVQACRCRNCQKVTTGELPAAIAKTGLVGPRMMGLLIFMKGAMRCSYSAIEEFLDHVLGFKVSRGYLAKVMVRGSRALEGPVEELRALLPSQRWLNVDETGHKDNGKRMWTWCFRAREFVLFSIQASRGSDVLLEMLGREFNGVIGQKLHLLHNLHRIG
jgi:transposase